MNDSAANTVLHIDVPISRKFSGISSAATVNDNVDTANDWTSTTNDRLAIEIQLNAATS